MVQTWEDPSSHAGQIHDMPNVWNEIGSAKIGIYPCFIRPISALEAVIQIVITTAVPAVARKISDLSNVVRVRIDSIYHIFFITIFPSIIMTVLFREWSTGEFEKGEEEVFVQGFEPPSLAVGCSNLPPSHNDGMT